MKIYLVGGFVRDKLLKIKGYTDKDWVVVGSNYNKMINLGYKPVGKIFPVFIHPITKEEYALARKDKKSGLGYKGFICNYSSNISLKDDLYRRDLTINAIAMDFLGNYYDPFNGIMDIKNRIIRHVSIYFKDDPLRLIRIARFYSYLFKFKFKIDFNTFILMKDIVYNNELLNITPERIWIELKKVLSFKYSFFFFDVLNKCNALKVVFPELFFVFNNFKYKLYFYLVFKKIDLLKYDLELNFVFLCLFFYKTIFSNEYFIYYKFIFNKIKNFCLRFNLPKKYFLLFSKIFIILKDIYFFKYKKNISIFILDIFYKINILNNINILFKLLKIINILIKFKIKNIDILIFLQNNFYKIFNLLNNINYYKFINFKDKINIKKNIYNFRLYKINKFFKI